MRKIAAAIRGRLSSKIHRLVGPPPVRSHEALWSAVAPLSDQVPQPTPELIELSIAASVAAANLSLDSVERRCRTEDQRRWVSQWPGEHYRLLAALAQLRSPRLVIEIGTYTGLSALSILHGLSADARLITYDVIAWNEFPDSALQAEDFGERLEQRLGDLSVDSFFAAEERTLADADLIFVDGPKDGRFEPIVLKRLAEQTRRGAIIVLDDIRFLSMIQLWRDLPLPKLDITSFGHWTGTGIALR